MALCAPRMLSLCAGYGGLDLGVGLARPGARTVGYVEREACAAACLVARMEDETLDRAPVWDDLTTFDGTAWRGCVDLVTAGFPCQPWSVAGKQGGLADDRWLWPAVLRVVVDVGAPYVYLENVPGLVTGHGLEPVLSDLAAHGFDAEWCCVGAGACGASHRRERVFILAVEHGRRIPELGVSLPAGRDEPSDGGVGLGVATGGGLPQRGSLGACVHEEQPPADGAGIPLFPPRPGERDAWAAIIERWPELAPAVADGELAGSSRSGGGSQPQEPQHGTVNIGAKASSRDGQAATEPPVRGVADGRPSRVDRLRMLGNGVVPVQAAFAFAVLADRVRLTLQERN